MKPPDDLRGKLRHEAAPRSSTNADTTREALDPHVGGRHLIAAKAGKSGRRDTARRIEEIIRQAARRSR